VESYACEGAMNQIFPASEELVTGGHRLVTGEPMQGKAGDRGDGRHHCEEHDCDEPGGAACSLGCGLGDAKGIDEGICEIEEQFHGLRGQMPVNGSKDGCGVP
jgi:hypothetical protein